MDTKETTSLCITIALPAGRLTPAHLAAVNAVAQQYELTVYLTTMQNLRLLGVAAEKIDETKTAETADGLAVQTPERCIGGASCG